MSDRKLTYKMIRMIKIFIDGRHAASIPQLFFPCYSLSPYILLFLFPTLPSLELRCGSKLNRLLSLGCSPSFFSIFEGEIFSGDLRH